MARGIIYLLVGALALRIAFGDHSAQADRGGALQTVAHAPFGRVLLWILAAGFAGLAAWRFAEAIYGQGGPDGRKATKRVSSAARGVFYAIVCATTASLAMGSGGTKSSDAKSKDATGRAMHDVPGGRWIVLIVGIALICAGIGIAYRALSKKFLKKLNTAQMTRRTRKVVEVLGMTGRTARGVVYAAAGALFAYAAITFDPGKAKGVDGTLRSFAGTPAGPWLLVAIALGLMTFGVYSCAEARYRRVNPG